MMKTIAKIIITQNTKKTKKGYKGHPRIIKKEINKIEIKHQFYCLSKNHHLQILSHRPKLR